MFGAVVVSFTQDCIKFCSCFLYTGLYRVMASRTN